MTIRVSPSAENVPGVSGQSGKYLTNDGKSLSWGTVSAGGVLLSTTTLSGSTTTISGISGSYLNLFILVQNVNLSSSTGFRLYPNNNSNQNVMVEHSGSASNTYAGFGTAATNAFLSGNSRNVTSGNTDNFWTIEIPDYAATSHRKIVRWYGHFQAGGADWTATQGVSGLYADNAAITSLVFAPGTGTFNGGTVKIYGVN